MALAPESEFRGTRRFRVIERLGGGGMGVVYRALDLERNAEVALKTVRVTQPETILRFKTEFHALADLAHPNLVGLGELFVENGQWFFTMELIDGVDLLSYVRPNSGLRAQHDTSSMPTVEAKFRWSRRTTPMEDENRVTPKLSDERGALDEEKLRAAVLQLARGLQALHDAGKVHRDVKPSNVMVAHDGRVVLLDFGLATDLGSVEHETEREVFGTTAYMAPEQAASQPVGPESDWYSVGVVLYEALTGHLPFEGPPLEVLMRKQREEPPPPRALAPEVPEDLDVLASELLRFERKARPSGRDVIRKLSRSGVSTKAAAQTTATQTAPFVGRARELGLLRHAFDEIRNPVACVVRGESGVGKSALVRRFVDELSATMPSLVALQGRCYERESVPYKAFDGLVDALSRHMRRLGKADAAALLPRHAWLLAQAFPVLGRVPVVAEAPRPHKDQEKIDPHELRGRVFAALRELLTRLAERAPLVLVVDDLHWADPDSFALLDEILRPPDAPPLLLVATARPGELPLPASVRMLEIGPLPEAEARALASLLLERAAGVAPDEARVTSIVDQTGGHPLFIDELARHDVIQDLDEALWSRVSALDDSSRRLLELACVAGRPLGVEVAGDAADLEAVGFDRALAVLRVANLLRTGSGLVEPYHDRVREAVVAHLDEDVRKEAHRKVASALEASGRADAEALAEHRLGAGETAAAARWAVRAADEAAGALAFNRAARLYRQAIELKSLDITEGRALRIRLGDALAAAGRGGEAAEAYSAAAEGAQVAEALDLRRRAAEQLLISGHIDDGLKVLDQVLQAVGMRFPPTPNRALASLVMRRARVRLRGLSFAPRDPSQISAEELTRIDVCWSVAAGLAIVDTVRGADFQTRNLLLSLRAGEPYRVARAFAMEAGFVATGGPKTRARVEKLLALAEELAKKTRSSHALGLQRLCSAIAAFLVGRWRDALRFADEAESILREQSRGVTWELDNARLCAMWSLLQLGEIGEVFRRGHIHLRDARERGDHYMVTNLRTRFLQLVNLCGDKPDEARREVQESLEGWTHNGFHFQHFNSLVMEVQVELYAGDGARAKQILDERRVALERSLVLRIILARIELTHLRASVAQAVGDAGETAKQAGLLRSCGLEWGRALGRLATTGVLLLRGDREGARGELSQAIEALDAVELGVIAQAARLQLAILANDAALQKKSEDWLRARNIVNPARYAAMMTGLRVQVP